MKYSLLSTENFEDLLFPLQSCKLAFSVWKNGLLMSVFCSLQYLPPALPLADMSPICPPICLDALLHWPVSWLTFFTASFTYSLFSDNLEPPFWFVLFPHHGAISRVHTGQAFCRCPTDWTWYCLSLAYSHTILPWLKLFESVSRTLLLSVSSGSFRLFLHHTLRGFGHPPPLKKEKTPSDWLLISWGHSCFNFLAWRLLCIHPVHIAHGCCGLIRFETLCLEQISPQISFPIEM